MPNGSTAFSMTFGNIGSLKSYIMIGKRVRSCPNNTGSSDRLYMVADLCSTLIKHFENPRSLSSIYASISTCMMT